MLSSRYIIGVGRFRILGGGKVWNIGGGVARGGANSQQVHEVVTTPCAHKVFNKSVPNNYILILKSDIIENSRIELRRIVWPAPSNQIKLKLHLLYFFPVSHRN